MVQEKTSCAKSSVLVALLSFAILSVAQAFAAEVAFYPFDEGDSGDDAVGVALQNAVDASVLGGSAVRNSGDAATATFLDDVPGRYLYTNSVWKADAIYSTNVFKSIQISWVTNANSAISSATSVKFNDLGARLAELDSWTVEFFFKFDLLWWYNDPNKGYTPRTYVDNISFGDDEKFGMCLQNTMTDGHFTGIRAYCGGAMARQSSATLSSTGAGGKELLPGIWHHAAVTYNGTTREFKVLLDYAHAGNSQTCTNESLSATAAFSLGNNKTAARFAALRVTDRVLSADELLRASDIPPDDETLDTRFHYTFEGNTTGASLGAVANEAPWRALYGAPVTDQYAFAIDGQTFWPSGDGIVTPTVFSYSDPAIGTLTLDGYASNVTDRARGGLLLPDGTLRENTNCAFLVAGPKNSSSENFGKGPSFLMSGADLLTASDFTAEMYWRPDFDGWNAVLGNDAGGRYRASLLGVAGLFKSDVAGKIDVQFAWDFYFNMKTTNFTFDVVNWDSAEGKYGHNAFYDLMKGAYLEKCNDRRLHHYAVVYRVSDADNSGEPTVRLYIDRTECATLTLTAPMVDFPAYFRNGMAFAVGGGLNDHPMQGWFDEIRYTARALLPSEFLVLQYRPASGMYIIVR